MAIDQPAQLPVRFPGENLEANRITKMDSMTHLTKMVERSK
jgi:hypothetical protein